MATIGLIGNFTFRPKDWWNTTGSRTIQLHLSLIWCQSSDIFIWVTRGSIPKDLNRNYPEAYKVLDSDWFSVVQ